MATIKDDDPNRVRLRAAMLALLILLALAWTPGFTRSVPVDSGRMMATGGA
jgi:hypothetical protein